MESFFKIVMGIIGIFVIIGSALVGGFAIWNLSEAIGLQGYVVEDPFRDFLFSLVLLIVSVAGILLGRLLYKATR